MHERSRNTVLKTSKVNRKQSLESLTPYTTHVYKHFLEEEKVKHTHIQSQNKIYLQWLHP